MAIGSTLDTFSAATKSVGLEYIDFYSEVKSYSAPMITTFVKADLDTLAGLVDPLTNARLCEGTIDKEKFYFAGGEAAADAVFPDVYDRMELEFRSASRCTQIARYSVLAPIEAAFQTPARKVVDSSNGAIAALATFLAAHLKSSNFGGLADWSYAGGRRFQDPLPDCLVG
jgi:hypothetical protein